MLQQTFLVLGQLWQLFEVSQILEFLLYFKSATSSAYALKDCVPTPSSNRQRLLFAIVVQKVCLYSVSIAELLWLEH